MLATAVLMDNLREMFFTDTTLTGDEHRQIGRGYLDSNVYRAVQPFRIAYDTKLQLYLLYFGCDHSLLSV